VAHFSDKLTLVGVSVGITMSKVDFIVVVYKRE
jgi:hypothetical protein